jgi:hypothetical protein
LLLNRVIHSNYGSLNKPFVLKGVCCLRTSPAMTRDFEKLDRPPRSLSNQDTACGATMCNLIIIGQTIKEPCKVSRVDGVGPGTPTRATPPVTSEREDLTNIRLKEEKHIGIVTHMQKYPGDSIIASIASHVQPRLNREVQNLKQASMERTVAQRHFQTRRSSFCIELSATLEHGPNIPPTRHFHTICLPRRRYLDSTPRPNTCFGINQPLAN